MAVEDNRTEKGLKHCFVIGPIGGPESPERKHADLLLHSILKAVLERPEHGFVVHRADEDVAPGMIGSKVVLDVVQSELCVADLTGLNANVFYELGIRHSAEKPVIHIAAKGTVLPFDNAPHHTIFVDLGDWHSQERARADLAKAAVAVSEPGFRVSNPITQANATFKMQHSADPLERVLAELKGEFDGFRAQLEAIDPSSPGMRLSRLQASPTGALNLAAADAADSTYAIGDRVFHHKFGYGPVVAVQGNRLTVKFEKAGQKHVIDTFITRAST